LPAKCRDRRCRERRHSLSCLSLCDLVDPGTSAGATVGNLGPAGLNRTIATLQLRIVRVIRGDRDRSEFLPVHAWHHHHPGQSEAQPEELLAQAAPYVALDEL